MKIEYMKSEYEKDVKIESTNSDESYEKYMKSKSAYKVLEINMKL